MPVQTHRKIQMTIRPDLRFVTLGARVRINKPEDMLATHLGEEPYTL
jgi:hypothetical protein